MPPVEVDVPPPVTVFIFSSILVFATTILSIDFLINVL